MSRSYPYRHKPPLQIIQTIGVASRITLYMVAQNGPTSFVFKDRLDHKFKVSIGGTIQCSCQPGKNDHCLHSIYVMIRVFSISNQNPLVWQQSYLDSELTDIVAGKYSQARRRRVLMESTVVDTPSQKIFDDEQFQPPKAERLPLAEDSPCPICQEPMEEEMLLTHCRVKCGNNFHLNCVKIWVEHKVTTQSPVTCPMCRCTWGKRILEQLTQEEEAYKSKQIKIELSTKAMEFSCKGCGLQKIAGPIFKCLFCEDYSLCVVCFNANKHLKHPFIEGEKGEWHGAPERRQKQKKIVEYINKRRQQSYNQEILMKLSKINEDPSKLMDYLASAYPYVSKYISQNIDPYKKLDFDQDEMRCTVCGSKRMIYLRRLTCGHFIDHNCLKECIVKGRFYCNEDGIQFLKGYESLLKRKEQMEKQITQKIDPRKKYNSVINSNQEVYNFNSTDLAQSHEQLGLDDILGNYMAAWREAQREPPVADRLRRRIDTNIIPSANHIVRETDRQRDNAIRIRNLSNNARKTSNNVTNPVSVNANKRTTNRPPSGTSRSQSQSRKPPQAPSGLSIQGIIARRLGQQ